MLTLHILGTDRRRRFAMGRRGGGLEFVTAMALPLLAVFGRVARDREETTSASNCESKAHTTSLPPPNLLHLVMIILHDLVPNQSGGQPWFSPATIVARLALLTKGVPFETLDVRYHDLRFVYKERLGVEKATGEQSVLRGLLVPSTS